MINIRYFKLLKIAPLILFLLFLYFVYNEPDNSKDGNLEHTREIVNNSEPEIISEEMKALAKIAFGDAAFGMLKKEVLQTNTFRGSSEFINAGHKVSLRAPEKSGIIGEYQFDVTVAFFKDSLYEVRIISKSFNGYEIESQLYNIADNLRDIISVKYGKPRQDYSNELADFIKSRPVEYDFEKYPMYLMYSWNYLNKDIGIWMQKNRSNNRFFIRLDIYDTEIRERASAQDEEELRLEGLRNKAIDDSISKAEAAKF